MRMRSAHVLLLMIAYAAATAGSAGSQQQVEARGGAPGELSGQIVDARTSEALEGATVVLEPVSGGLLPSVERGGSAFLQRTRSVLTGTDGEYRFRDLPPGSYRLRIQRLGYTATSIELDLRRHARSAPVSVGLGVHPIALNPVEVPRGRHNPFSATRHALSVMPEAARIGETPNRPGHGMASDARVLTYEEVVEAVTLGETDIFRAVQRLPGVSARDDYTAVLWTRGAPWDQTRVYFDGLPLYNPTHAGWLVSSVNPDAIGAAFFQPGVRDASVGEGAAGVLELESRAGGTSGGFRGAGELSVISGRLALDGELPADQGGWMLAARRSYLDLVSRALGAVSDNPHLPFAFSDVIGRLDLRFSDRWTMEASGIWEEDQLNGDLPGLIYGNSATWGNAGGRVTVEGPLGPLQASHTAGVSRFEAVIRERESGAEDRFDGPLLRERPTDNWVYHASIGSEVSPRGTDQGPPSWSAGVEGVAQAVSYDGPVYPPPRVASAAPRGEVEASPSSPVSPQPRRVLLASELRYGVLWGERRWMAGERAAVQTGLRLEAGDEVRNGGGVRAAPRVSARYALDPALAISGGWGRSYQYTQAISAAGQGIGPELHLSYLWGLAGEVLPAIRSDVATAGVERWFGDHWLTSANAYLRLADGIAVPDPSPGLFVHRSLFETARNRAYGVELSARKLAGVWTGSISYTAATSELETGEFRYSAPADRSHSLDLTATVQISPSLRVGGAFSGATGTPFTRHIGRDTVRVGQPGEHRGPPYASADFMLDWSTELWLADLSAYVQVRNVLNRNNAVTYQRSDADCPEETAPVNIAMCNDPRVTQDHFVNGLPRLPLLGLRVTF